MRKKIVAGNWKMNTNLSSGYELIHDILGKVKEEDVKNTEIIFFPPSTHLKLLSNSITGAAMYIGAQNCHQEESGAYTGEISASMLSSIPVQYVLIGHSERRMYFGENNTLLNQKMGIALNSGLKTIYCFGETLEEREAGNHFDVVKKQLEEGLKGLEASQFERITIAYEPVWAIGTGKTASALQAQEIHIFARKQIADAFGQDVAGAIRILYGGSVKPANANELFNQADIDGGLIGGAALKADDFLGIIRA